jgi:hypothetical protein
MELSFAFEDTRFIITYVTYTPHVMCFLIYVESNLLGDLYFFTWKGINDFILG